MDNRQHKTNHLLGQSSPYLLQHLYNPVDWYPWGDKALGKALKEDKPIIVSIGYSACHWCHVMEKESFEDTEIAEIMNRDFVCIKVDREERPDIDHMYMTAVQLLTRQGGWPLNCFALPDTRPFWGGTYFRKEQWKSILEQISRLYREQKDDLSAQAEKLVNGIAAANFIDFASGEESFHESDAQEIFKNLMKYMDKEEGGTVGAPKFPLPVNIEFLLDYHFYSGNESSLEQVSVSLDKMAMGGIYDQIGGGFARYSTDEIWKVPHFEKMLYDNGQLLSVYSKAWKVLGKPLYKDVVYQTVEFMERELVSPDGAYYAALDADSDGEEGKYYVWSESEIDQLLGDDAPLIKKYYQVGKKGHWEEGNNILIKAAYDLDFAAANGLKKEELNEIVDRANRKLLAAREKRVSPGLDNKVLTSWNALVISGLAEAYTAFGEKSFIDKAIRAAEFIIENGITPEGKIYRALQGKGHSVEGFLEDYALFIQALIRLYEITSDNRFILIAKELAVYVISNFSVDGTSMLSFSSRKGEVLKAPFFETGDNVIPASNSVMAVNLFILGGYFENSGWDDHSLQMLNDIRARLAGQSINYSNWGRLLLYRAFDFFTLVITGPEAEQRSGEIASMFLPSVRIAASGSDNVHMPLFNDRFRGDQTWYYVCKSGRCNMPVREIALAIEQIRKK